MFLAHIPASYLLTPFLQKRLRNPDRRLMIVGPATAMLPDLDLLYYYLLDPFERSHHEYFTHFLLFWLSL